MLPLERQKQIKEAIQAEHFVKITDLSKRFGVSEMTIHRDIKPLTREGIAVKTFGGISLAQQKQSIRDSDPDGCIYCNREIQERLVYRLILDNNQVEKACCAHCGLLRHHQLGDNVAQALCTDFFKQTTISAALAWYVLDATAEIDCCHPQVLTFAQKETADKFVHGFGGQVFSSGQINDAMLQRMSGGDTCCRQHPE